MHILFFLLACGESQRGETADSARQDTSKSSAPTTLVETHEVASGETLTVTIYPGDIVSGQNCTSAPPSGTDGPCRIAGGSGSERADGSGYDLTIEAEADHTFYLWIWRFPRE